MRRRLPRRPMSRSARGIPAVPPSFDRGGRCCLGQPGTQVWLADPRSGVPGIRGRIRRSRRGKPGGRPVLLHGGPAPGLGGPGHRPRRRGDHHPVYLLRLGSRDRARRGHPGVRRHRSDHHADRSGTDRAGARGPRTKAIIAVDYGGHPCGIEEIVKMAGSGASP